MKNQLHYSFLLCLTIIGVLLVLSLFKNFSIGSFSFKKLDPLEDIRVHEPESTIAFSPLDSIAKPEERKKQDSIVARVIDKCPPGISCIEDYSSDSTALKKFLQALVRTEKNKNPVRIAFYGDSFIEGDVFCGSFRDTLQSIYGGRGVGFVPITSEVAGFRNTIKHQFRHWKTRSMMNKRDSTIKVGPSGFAYAPLEGNWVQYKPSKQRYLREFNTVRLYYKSYKDAIVHYKFDTTEWSDVLEASGKLEEWKYKTKNAKLVEFEFDPFDSLYVYGASFENNEGICVDNFSIRGNSGMNLSAIASRTYKDFNKFRNYKLIILQFGLNMITEESFDYGAYAKKMEEVIKTLKKNFPECSFLLLSVSDRSSNTSGEFKTMNSIPAMRDAQRLIAQRTGIAFWDMYEAMGGQNSMVKFSEAEPPLGARDYTHLTFKGGKKLAGALAKSLLFEKKKHDERRKK
jgi:lysophospholipase L1-like esterase